MGAGFDILIVGQKGRLTYEAVLLAASLRAADPGFAGRLVVAEPQPGPLWSFDPRMDDAEARERLEEFGAEILPFESRLFGEGYPNGNKAEALAVLPPGAPFLFLDTDTLVTGALSAVPVDVARPTASMRRENTWPRIELYGPDLATIWGALYDRFGLDMGPSLDRSQPEGHWRRHLYFNAGWFLGPCPATFGRRLCETMAAIRDDPGPALEGQALYPWLDQIALPLVVHALGGGRPGPDLAGFDDGRVLCHWRAMPLLYARESAGTLAHLESVAAPNRIKKVLKRHPPFLRTVYQGRGHKVRALFEDAPLPRTEAGIRKRIRAAGLWMR